MLACRRPATASASRWNRARSCGPAYAPVMQHLEGDEAVEPEVPGLVDHAHAPAAEEGLHLIARDPRQLGARMPGNGGIGAGPGRAPAWETAHRAPP